MSAVTTASVVEPAGPCTVYNEHGLQSAPSWNDVMARLCKQEDMLTSSADGCGCGDRLRTRTVSEDESHNLIPASDGSA